MIQPTEKNRHSLARLHRRRPPMQLAMVPMIDIVFLLLVFFLLTASFRAREAFLPAELPRTALSGDTIELEPLLLRLDSLPNGTCQVRIGPDVQLVLTPKPQGLGFEPLTQQLARILHDQGRRRDDPVKLIPTAQTKWDHVVKTYHALWQLNLSNIIFTMVE